MRESAPSAPAGALTPSGADRGIGRDLGRSPELSSAPARVLMTIERPMAEVNLLARYPRSKRNIEKRTSAQSEENIRIAAAIWPRVFRRLARYGYGGYRYDGRWLPIAEDMVAHWRLKPGDRVLDVGCAKGFLVKDFMKACPGSRPSASTSREYAADALRARGGRPPASRQLRQACRFPTTASPRSIAVNVVHNLERAECIARGARDRAPGAGARLYPGRFLSHAGESASSS